MSGGRFRSRAELLDRLRRFEWDVARDEQARAAHAALRSGMHDLLNMVQIVDLGSQALAPHCAPAGAELIADLAKAADDGKAAVRGLQALAQGDERSPVRTEVGACARAAVELVAGAMEALDAKITVDDVVAIAWTPEELELVLIALALDGTRDREVELLVRTRAIDGHACVEIVCGPLDASGVGARLAAALATRIGGDCAIAERRGGGDELAVTLPVLRGVED